MMNCQQATRLMSDAQERKLTLMDRISLKIHVSVCFGCRNFSRHMGSLRNIAQVYAKGESSEKEIDVAVDSEEVTKK